MSLSILSCKNESEFEDLRKGSVQFGLKENTYTNQSEFTFSAQSSLKGHFSEGKTILAVYSSSDCTGDFEEQSQSSFNEMRATALEDGTVYSFQILVEVESKSYRSECTPWLGIDQQPPDPVTPMLPPANTYITQTNLQVRWNPSTDNGISGLAPKPYRIKLFDQAACVGNIINSMDTDSLLEEFAGLTHGAFYSYQVLALDRAGNESPVSCSPSTEIDLYAPGISISNSGSDPTYTNDQLIDVAIENDSWAGYWCLTTDSTFNPNSNAEACPGGQGPSNGWHTTRPTSYTLTPGDGLKDIYLVLLNGDGDKRTEKRPKYTIELDTVAPAAFSVTGLTGGTDVVVDEYLTDNVDPVVHWTASSALKNYSISILNPDNSENCQLTATASSTEGTLLNCSLSSSVTYKVRMSAIDYAGNLTSAPDFNFSLDLAPPGPFSISGVRGTTDTVVDAWAPGPPEVLWTSSSDAVDYHISVRSGADGSAVCPEQTVASPGLSYDFNLTACGGMTNGSFYEVLLRSRDDATLFTTASNQPFSFRLDSEAPVINFSSQPAALNNNPVATYNFNVSDSLSGIATTECRWNGGAYSTCSTTSTLGGLAQGNHTFEIRSVDLVGNIGTDSHTFDLDVTAPTVTIVSGPNAFTNNSAASVSFTAVDSGAAGVMTTECSLDSGAWFTCSSPHLEPLLSEGAHTLSVRATDNLNQISPAVTHGWMIDLTPPVLTFASGPSSAIISNGSTATASVSFTPADTVGVSTTECRWDGGSYSSCTSPATRSGLTAGSHSLDVRVTDTSGNQTVQTHTVLVTVHSWLIGAWGACSATPSWTGWGACSASPYWGGWGSCSGSPGSWSTGSWSTCTNSSCYGGTQSRSVSCVSGSGSQSRTCYGTSGTSSRTCLNTSGTQSRSVTCRSDNGTTQTPVADGNCSESKPAISQACTESCSGSSTQACSASCSGSSTQSCSMGCSGGAPASSQSCTAGIACRVALNTIQELTGVCNITPTSGGTNNHASTCYSAGAGGWTDWLSGASPANCPIAPHRYKLTNYYQCQFCPSGNWGSKTVTSTYGGATATSIICL